MDGQRRSGRVGHLPPPLAREDEWLGEVDAGGHKEGGAEPKGLHRPRFASGQKSTIVKAPDEDEIVEWDEV